MFKIKNQIRKLYTYSIFSNFSLGGACWVALLAARGFSMVQIGFAEAIFHVTSLIFEIPSGALADSFGRKKTLVISRVMAMISSIIMVVSTNYFEVCLALVFASLSYNFASGTGAALAYDSLKKCGKEQEYMKYSATETIIYRIGNGTALLCAGLALTLGYRIANGVDAVLNLITILIALTLTEVPASDKPSKHSLVIRIMDCFKESFSFLKGRKEVIRLMLWNSFIGAVAILLLFFLQAKLPLVGIPTTLLGAALFFMELGGVLGSKLTVLFQGWSYRKLSVLCVLAVATGVLLEGTGLWIWMSLGGFLAACADDLIQVRSDAMLNEMIPSEQRATLISVSSFCFSVFMIVLSPLAGIFSYI